MALDHLQFSKPFLKYKYWHWLCYLNTSFTKVAVRSNFSLLQLIAAFPFICPFGVVRCWELSLSFLCLLPQESSDVTHLPDDLVWKCILFEWPFQMWACDWFSLLRMMKHSSFCVRSTYVNSFPGQHYAPAATQSTLATLFIRHFITSSMGKGASHVPAIMAEHACTYPLYTTQTYLLLFVFLLVFVSSQFITAVFGKKFNNVRQGSFAVLSWQFS